MKEEPPKKNAFLKVGMFQLLFLGTKALYELLCPSFTNVLFCRFIDRHQNNSLVKLRRQFLSYVNVGLSKLILDPDPLSLYHCVPQNLPQIYTVIASICNGKVA